MNNELAATRRPDINLQAGCCLGLFKEESTKIGVYDWSRTLLDIGDLSRAFLFFRVSEHPIETTQDNVDKVLRIEGESDDR
jgi:hypothetical protein